MHQLGDTTSFHQKPKQYPLPILKRTVESYIATVCKAGGMFTFGTICYEPFLMDTGQIIATYVTMNEEQRQPFDIQVKNKLVAILIIKGCKYSGLQKWLAQQQLSPDIACAYPVITNVAGEMIKDGVWSEDQKNTCTGKLNLYKKNDYEMKNGAVGGIIQDVDNEEEAGTMEHVLAMVDSNSNGIECHNSFDSTQKDFNNEDPGEVIGAIVAIKKEDSQTTYKNDDYKCVNHNNQDFQDIHNMVNQENNGG